MRAGQVVRIRVNPKDCMSVLDVMEVTGMQTQGMSFSAIVSLALSSAMEGLRQQGVIPTRTGFEFSDMMSVYLRGSSQGRKVAMTNAIYNAGSEFQVRPVAMPADLPEDDGYIEPVDNPTPEVLRARRALAELCAKKELSEQNSAVMWQAEDQREYEKNYRIVYPGESLV
jgi:hypothetical protein